jgi:mevalonate kinase
MKSCKVRAPAKLILSGEHAVVYGTPALAMAVDRYAETTVLSSKNQDDVQFDIKSLSHSKKMTYRALRDLKSTLKDKYRRFQSGQLSIGGILKTPLQLAHFTAINAFDRVKEKMSGLHLHIDANIPNGCGMGSSAALAVSMTYAIAQFYELDLSEADFIELAQDAEKLQHGFPSGLDVLTSLRGGTLLFQKGQAVTHDTPTFPLYLVNTGKPQSSTGETVVAVKKSFENSPIWQDFEATTLSMSRAIQDNNLDAFKRAIEQNETLLETIGVVPKAVQDFIQALAKIGSTAKICGAGSIDGNSAGVLLIVPNDIAATTQLCHQHHFQLEMLYPVAQGAHCV